MKKTNKSNPLEKKSAPKPLITRLMPYKRLILIIGVIILIVAAGVYMIASPSPVVSNNNTTNAPNNNGPSNNSTVKHYEDAKVAFDYPADWNQSKIKVEPPMLVRVEKDENNSFTIYSEDLAGLTFADYVISWRENLNKISNITFEQVIPLDGAQAYDVQASARDETGTYITRDLILEKNKKVYYLVFAFDGSMLDHKEEMDLILSSLRIK